jgi:hypothetical protein
VLTASSDAAVIKTSVHEVEAWMLIAVAPGKVARTACSVTVSWYARAFIANLAPRVPTWSGGRRSPAPVSIRATVPARMASYCGVHFLDGNAQGLGP